MIFLTYDAVKLGAFLSCKCLILYNFVINSFTEREGLRVFNFKNKKRCSLMKSKKIEEIVKHLRDAGEMDF